MSSRPLLKPQKVITDGDMSDDVVSIVSNVNMIDLVSYSVSWTGAPVGDFFVEVCNDYQPTPAGVIPSNPVNGSWTPVELFPEVEATGELGSACIDIYISTAWIRLSYVRSSGTGVLNATIAGKC